MSQVLLQHKNDPLITVLYDLEKKQINKDTFILHTDIDYDDEEVKGIFYFKNRADIIVELNRDNKMPNKTNN